MSYDLISGDAFVGYDYDDSGMFPHYDIIGQQGGYMTPYQNPALARQLAQQRALAYRGGGGGYNPSFQAALAAKRAQAGAILRGMNPTKARKQVLGMVSNGTIAAAGTATITSRPQTFAFKPERIVIPATVGPDFTIQDIKVGNVSQLVQSGDLPAEGFSQTSFGVEMDMDTVQTSQDFILQVTNISGGARTFRALIIGRSANG